MSTGSRRIDDLESAEVLDDKDEFLFFQNSSKRTKKITRNKMLNSRGVVTTLQAAGVGSADTVAPNTPALPTVTTVTERDRDGTEKVYIKAEVAANSETDLASYGWSLRRASGTPVFSGGYLSATTSANGNGEPTTTSYGGTAQIFDAVVNVSPAPQGQKMQWDVRANTYYEVRVCAIDKSGNRSSYTALTGPTNGTVILSARDTTPPGPPTSVTANSAIKSVFLDWINDTATDLAGVKIYRNTVNNFSTATLKATVYATSFTDTSTAQGTSYYYWLTSIDYSGNESTTQATPSTFPIVPGLVANTDITTFAVDATKMFTNTVILKADVWTDNSPSAGYISWNAHTLVYGGASYSISAGSTNLQFVYWTGGTTYQTSDTNPALSDGHFMIATNAKNEAGVAQGLHDLAWNAIANAVIGSAYIQNAAITNAKISELNADKIRTGSITSQTITLDSDGVFKSSGATSFTSGIGFWLEGGASSRFGIGDLSGADYGFLKWVTSSNSLTIKGEIRATSGFFGSATTAVSVGNLGLSVGTTGRITSGLEWDSSGAGKFTTSGNGFFLGYASSQYRFFIGKTGTDGLGLNQNYLYWNGTSLTIGGTLEARSTSDSTSGAGITISSGFGIRYANKNSVLTINGGDGNGAQYGAQIDFIGSEYDTDAGDDGNGRLSLQAAYKEGAGFNGPADGSILFSTSYKQTSAGGAFQGVPRMIIELDGTVRIIEQSSGTAPGAGSAAPNAGAGKLVVESTVTAETYTSTSSKRFKKKIKNLKNGKEIISKLRPVIFDWKTKDLKNDIGLIAEEVNEVVPNLVGFNNKGEVVGIDYGKLTPILIQAVKELSLEVDRLKNKIK